MHIHTIFQLLRTFAQYSTSPETNICNLLVYWLPCPEGWLVLVTGANGYVAGITIQKLLDTGYHVCGSVGDRSKHQRMISHHDPKFELIAIPELSAPRAFGEAFKGVNGIARIASSLTFVSEAEEAVIRETSGMISILEPGKKEATV